MEIENIVNEYLDDVLSGKWVTEGNELCIFVQLANNHKDSILSFRFGQGFNKVHCYMLTSHVRDREELKQSRIRDMFNLVFLAYGAIFYECSDICFQSKLMEKCLSLVVSYSITKVTS
jgi:hypothetical protein